MRKTPRWVLALALVSVASFVFSGLQAGALLLAMRSIPASATVKTVNLQVYQDAALTTVLQYLNWSLIEPGQTKLATVYLYSNCTTPMTLALTSSAWSPSVAQQYLTVSWNMEGQVLQPKTVTTATLSLSLASNVTGIEQFSFDLTFTGSG